jgi:hypothetical protein
MTGLPSPEDVAVKILVWIGAPAILIALYTSLLALLGWVSLVKSSRRNVSLAVRRTRETLRDWTTARQRAAVRLVAASTLFVAVAYSLTQLAGVTYEKVDGNTSIADGLSFDGTFLFSQLVGYQHWTRLSAWTVLAALLSIFLLNVANLIRLTGLRKLITLVWGVVLGLGMLFGLLLILAGVCVLLLGLTHYDNYQPSMAILYALWVGCLFLLPWLAERVQRGSVDLFDAGSRT